MADTLNKLCFHNVKSFCECTICSSFNKRRTMPGCWQLSDQMRQPIIIISKTMFTVLSLWWSHCENSFLAVFRDWCCLQSKPSGVRTSCARAGAEIPRPVDGVSSVGRRAITGGDYWTFAVSSSLGIFTLDSEHTSCVQSQPRLLFEDWNQSGKYTRGWGS